MGILENLSDIRKEAEALVDCLHNIKIAETHELRELQEIKVVLDAVQERCASKRDKLCSNIDVFKRDTKIFRKFRGSLAGLVTVEYICKDLKEDLDWKLEVINSAKFLTDFKLNEITYLVKNGRHPRFPVEAS